MNRRGQAWSNASTGFTFVVVNEAELMCHKCLVLLDPLCPEDEGRVYTILEAGTPWEEGRYMVRLV